MTLRIDSNYTIAQQALIKSLPITDIENLAEALLDFKGIEDLEVWLNDVAKV